MCRCVCAIFCLVKEKRERRPPSLPERALFVERATSLLMGKRWRRGSVSGRCRASDSGIVLRVREVARPSSNTRHLRRRRLQCIQTVMHQRFVTLRPSGKRGQAAWEQIRGIVRQCAAAGKGTVAVDCWLAGRMRT